jgi:hypothetical protein
MWRFYRVSIYLSSAQVKSTHRPRVTHQLILEAILLTDLPKNLNLPSSKLVLRVREVFGSLPRATRVPVLFDQSLKESDRKLFSPDE